MPATRIKTAQTVATALHDAEAAIDAAAALSSRFTAILIEARRQAHLLPEIGDEEIALVNESAAYAVKARSGLVRVHTRLAALAADLNIPLAVGVDDCDFPATVFTTAADEAPAIG